MSIFTKIKDFFNPIMRWLSSFLKELFSALMKEAFAKLLEIAIEVVNDLANADLSNVEKRQEAYAQIKVKAMAKGLEAKDSLINLAIELCVLRLKI